MNILQLFHLYNNAQPALPVHRNWESMSDISIHEDHGINKFVFFIILLIVSWLKERRDMYNFRHLRESLTVFGYLKALELLL